MHTSETTPKQENLVNTLCGVFIIASALLTSCSRDLPELKAAESPLPEVKVRVEVVQPRDLPETVTAVGTVTSMQQSVLSAKLMAHVTAVLIKEGDRVRRGQVVAELDPREVQAQLRKTRAGLQESREALEEVEQAMLAAQHGLAIARAQHELALATMARYQPLLNRHSVAPQEYDEVAARSQVTAGEVQRAAALAASLQAKKRQVLAKITEVEADVTQAAVQTGYASVHTPLDGIVVAKPVVVGMLTAPGNPLVVVEEEHYYLHTAVEESSLDKLQLGQSTPIVIDALAQDITGRVIEIIPTADAASRTITVKVALPPMSHVRSGLYGKAFFPVGQRRTLLIPHEALITRGQLQGVFVVNGQEAASLRWIKIGQSHNNEIEVLSGLEAGERVIVQGMQNVRDGHKVIVDSEKERTR